MGGSATVTGGSTANGGSSAGGVTTNGGSSVGGVTTSGGVSGNDAGAPCIARDGSVAFELRDCFADSDCVMRAVPDCCNAARVIGISTQAVCSSVSPHNCAAVDCAALGGFITDDGQRTFDPTQIRTMCKVGEPGAGLCQTTLLGTNDVVCGDETCDPGALCVHRSARGGPAPRCSPVPADGACPSDTEHVMDCGGQPGCREVLVVPEPDCAPIPPGCGAPTGCSCLPAELCGAPQICSAVMGRHVYCVDISP
jgi:hypothetical protein